jgi:hypothetical protein
MIWGPAHLALMSYPIGPFFSEAVVGAKKRSVGAVLRPS